MRKETGGEWGHKKIPIDLSAFFFLFKQIVFKPVNAVLRHALNNKHHKI